MTLGPRQDWTSWTGSRASTTACAYTQPSDAWPLSQRSAACWLHDLVYVETRQGQGLRKLSKNRGSFPSDEALTKLVYLDLLSQKWTMPIRDWKAALTRFTIQFGDRISIN